AVVHRRDLSCNEVGRRVRDVPGAVTGHETVVVVHMEEPENVTDFVAERPLGGSLRDDRTRTPRRECRTTVEWWDRRSHEVDDHVVRACVVSISEELILLSS